MFNQILKSVGAKATIVERALILTLKNRLIGTRQDAIVDHLNS